MRRRSYLLDVGEDLLFFRTRGPLRERFGLVWGEAGGVELGGIRGWHVEDWTGGKGALGDSSDEEGGGH